MPWRQQINLPDEGELIIGRSTQALRGNRKAQEALQISREHARFYRDPSGDLYVQDLDSANGTYVDQVPAGAGSLLRAGQVLRIALDLECQVIRLNEHGEPVD
jgi:pSer/pThr/pTyr-binding forkhead associated (FHA) protein